MTQDTEPAVGLIRINAEVGWNCNFQCEDCYRFFDCPSPRRNEFYQGARIEAISANLKHVKHILTVMSGKGGVGKSIISANLAVALSTRGYAVAVMDSDLYGPSIPSILGKQAGRFQSGPRGMVPPQTEEGIKIVSMEFLLDDTDPLTWFSDLKRSTQEQFLANTDYGHLDYLIIDMPPGTGSEVVNLLKYLPRISGAIIVTIPSDVAEQVVHRGLSLCRKAGVPILGLIENLSGFRCLKCGAQYLGDNRQADSLAREIRAPLLGRVPRDPLIVDGADSGVSFLLSHPEAEASKNFNRIVDRVEEQLGGASPVRPPEQPRPSVDIRLPEILEINAGYSCHGKSCYGCSRYFRCELTKKIDIHQDIGARRIREAMAGIKYKIAVMSCKGGVGKSTFSANLAAALAVRGKKTVLLDCDFHGPCIPKILGIEKAGLKIGKRGIIPVSGAAGVRVISVGFLLDPKEAVTWFDLLKKTTVAQFLYGVDYGSVDYLIIDLPPGTGAESYGLLQLTPGLDGVVVITLPSESPQTVAQRSIGLCRQANVPVLGIVENMSRFVCPVCNHVAEMCGSRKARNLSERLAVPFLGDVPLDVNISKSCDQGVPFVTGFPESVASRSIFGIADQLELALSRTSRAGFRP
ncbi:MAG: Mrp/NBP35 family ATP-binding protein [Desulfobacterales bacterium]|nr:Mrp/NBP35 family ATP-binding protein [Desulfobacterales bacterium]